MISRRDALKIASLGLTGFSAQGFPKVEASRQNNEKGWNWLGNPGQTEEYPGPGLNLGGPIGELWRIPAYDGRQMAGLWNGCLFAVDGYRYMRRNPWGWRIKAIDCDSGSDLWTLSAPGFENANIEETSIEMPELGAISFSRHITILDNIVIITLDNGQLWAVHSISGEIAWQFDSGYDHVQPPAFVGRNGFLVHDGGILALSIDDKPSVHWDVELPGPNTQLLGVDDTLVWVGTDEFVIALDSRTGSEFWRISATDIFDLRRGVGTENSSWQGLIDGSGLFHSGSTDELLALDGQGQIAWALDDQHFISTRKWIAGDTITRASEPEPTDDWKTCEIQCLSAANGSTFWSFEVDAQRWWWESLYTPHSQIIICDGIAYTLIRDKQEDQLVLVAVDPIQITVRGIRDTMLTPRVVGGGILIANDIETEEIVCIGSVPGTLRPGGRARVTRETTLYGAPSTSSIDRGKVEEGIELEVTGDPESTNSGDWYPISIPNSDLTGWLPASSLLGLVGDIVFEPMDINIFGQITTY